jgi:hypothetical protein
LKEIWYYNETVRQLFRDFKENYDSFRRKGLYTILTDFGVLVKLVRLTEMCIKESYSKVLIGKHLSDTFLIQNALSPQLLNYGLEYAIRKVQENKVGLKLNGTHQLLVYADDVNLLADNIESIKKNGNCK